jgi:hypothetical protein
MKIFHSEKELANSNVELEISADAIVITVSTKEPTVNVAEDGGVTQTGEFFTRSSTASISIEDLKTSPQAETGACWNVYMHENSRYPVLMNLNAMSQPFRADVHQSYIAYVQKPPVAVICIPLMDSKLDDCLIGVNTLGGEDSTFKCSLPFTELGADTSLDSVRKMVLPKFVMTGAQSIKEGDTDTFTVTAQNADGSTNTSFNDPIYFEATGGILAVSKVKAVNGVAQVRLVGAHLIAGDVVSVKAGTKFYTSLAKMDVQVTA